MALTAVFLAGLTAGCDSSNDETFKASTAPVAVPAAPQQAGQQALDAYRKMWDTVVRMKLTSDYQLPELAFYAEDQALGYFRATTKYDFERGFVGKGQPTLNPQVVEENPTQVRVVDCLDDSQWLKYWISNGQLKDDVPGGRHHGEATVVLTDGVWRVRHLVLEGVGTC